MGFLLVACMLGTLGVIFKSSPWKDMVGKLLLQTLFIHIIFFIRISFQLTLEVGLCMATFCCFSSCLTLTRHDSTFKIFGTAQCSYTCCICLIVGDSYVITH